MISSFSIAGCNTCMYVHANVVKFNQYVMAKANLNHKSIYRRETQDSSKSCKKIVHRYPFALPPYFLSRYLSFSPYTATFNTVIEVVCDCMYKYAFLILHTSRPKLNIIAGRRLTYVCTVEACMSATLDVSVTYHTVTPLYLSHTFSVTFPPYLSY